MVGFLSLLRNPIGMNGVHTYLLYKYPNNNMDDTEYDNPVCTDRNFLLLQADPPKNRSETHCRLVIDVKTRGSRDYCWLGNFATRVHDKG